MERGKDGYRAKSPDAVRANSQASALSGVRGLDLLCEMAFLSRVKSTTPRALVTMFVLLCVIEFAAPGELEVKADDDSLNIDDTPPAGVVPFQRVGERHRKTSCLCCPTQMAQTKRVSELKPAPS